MFSVDSRHPRLVVVIHFWAWGGEVMEEGVAAGGVDPAHGTPDGRGNLINDWFTTDFSSGGFDLDAVGTLSVLPASFSEWILSQKRSDASPSADPKGTGLPQLVEYFTGGRNLEVKVSGGAAVVEFDWLSYRMDGDFWIEGSTDLQEWHVLARSNRGGVMAGENGASITVSAGQTKRVKVNPGATPFRFFRLGGGLP